MQQLGELRSSLIDTYSWESFVATKKALGEGMPPALSSPESMECNAAGDMAGWHQLELHADVVSSRQHLRVGDWKLVGVVNGGKMTDEFAQCFEKLLSTFGTIELEGEGMLDGYRGPFPLYYHLEFSE